MNTFQIVMLIVLGAGFIGSIVKSVRRRLAWRAMFIVTLIWMAASITVVWPEFTSMIAKALGIGRGADLLLYCSVVVMLIGFFMVYIRLVRLRRYITTLVRHISLLEAQGPLESTPSGAAPASGTSQPQT